MGNKKYHKLIGMIGLLLGLFVIDPLLGYPFYHVLVYLFGEPGEVNRLVITAFFSLLVIFLIGRSLYKRYSKSSQ